MPAVKDQLRDWPILLAMRMRDSAWVNAQVELVGRVECRSPDPLSVMNVGGRYEVNHRQVRAARRHLDVQDREAITAYLLRESEMVLKTDQDGRRFYAAQPPPMRDEEATAFRHLWHALADAGHVERRPARPPREQPGAEGEQSSPQRVETAVPVD